MAAIKHSMATHTAPDSTIREDPAASSPLPGAKPYGTHRFGTSNNNETSCIIDKRLNNPSALHDYLQSIRAHPVAARIRITGIHQVPSFVDNDDEQHYKNIQDFEIDIDLASDNQGREIVARSNTAVCRRRRNIVDLETDDHDEKSPTLLHWCQSYCKSKALIKVFLVNRRVTGIDQEFMSNQICEQLRAVGYHGKIVVSFPVDEQSVDIYNANWFNKCRRNAFIEGMAVGLFFWVVIWPYICCRTQFWNVYVLEYEARPAMDGVVVSEKHFVKSYARLIVDLAKSSFKGNAASLLKHALPPSEEMLSYTQRDDKTRKTPDFEGTWLQHEARASSGWGHHQSARKRVL